MERLDANHARGVDTAMRVILGEPRPLMRVALRRCLTDSGFSVRGEGDDAADIIDLALAERPQLCVLASDLPGSPITAIVAIRSAMPETEILVLAERERVTEAFDFVRMGASGYLSKDIAYEALPRALRGILRGEAGLSRSMMGRLLGQVRALPSTAFEGEAPDRSAGLTLREAEVLRLLSSGSTTAEIAGALSISPITARRHCSEIRRKLGAQDRAAVLALVKRDASPG
jgi:DNA-binding NarL/FixJ family response regulator